MSRINEKNEKIKPIFGRSVVIAFSVKGWKSWFLLYKMIVRLEGNYKLT